MNNEEPQGGSNMVSEIPSGTASAEQAPVTPTTENFLGQANAGPIGAAEATGGTLPTNGTPPPAIENSSTLNPANPFEQPNTNSLNATHQAMVAGKEAAKNEQNTGGFWSKIKNLSPIKAKTENVNSTPSTPVEGGVGIMPGSTQIEPPLPPGANQNLASGTTPPVPNVTPEASAAVNTPNQTQSVETTAHETAASVPAAQPTEGTSNNINGQSTTEDLSAEASMVSGMPQPDAHPEIAQFDKDKAAEGAAQDNAQNEANKKEAEQPDLLKVDQSEPKTEPTAPVASVEDAQPADIPSGLPEAPRDEVNHIDGTASHPDAPVVGQESSLPTTVNAVTEPGDTPLELQANELDKKGEDESSKWTIPPSSSEATSTLNQVSELVNNTGAQELTSASAPSTETMPSSDGGIISETTKVADTTSQMLGGEITPTSESKAFEPTMSADKVAVETPIAPTSTTNTAESPTIPEPETPSGSEPTVPDNNVSAISGITPQTQTPEQIAAAKSGTPLTAVGTTETQSAFGQPADATGGTSNPTGETGSLGSLQSSGENDESSQGGNTGTSNLPPTQVA